MADEINSDKKDVGQYYPFVEDDNYVWVWHAGKSGGVNGPGPDGGIYKLINIETGVPTGDMAMIKRDTKNGAARVEKVIGEFVAGQALNVVYAKTMDNWESRVAQVSLMKTEKVGNISSTDNLQQKENGDNVYLKSDFIKGYKNDFWKFAYQDIYQDRFRKIIQKSAGNDKSQTLLATRYAKRLNEYYGKELLETKSELAEANNKITSLNAIADKSKYANAELLYLNGKKEGLLAKVEVVENNIKNATTANIKQSIKDPAQLESISDRLAKAKVSEMKRPSGVILFGPYAKWKVWNPLSKVLRKHENFKQQFAEVVAPRLWLGDRGLHNANIGVKGVTNPDGKTKLELVSLDFGATFEGGFPSKIDPYAIPKTKKFYKNHFLEYNNDVLRSKEMGVQFLKIGGDQAMQKTVLASMMDSLKLTANTVDLDTLKKMGKRMGMEKSAYLQENNADNILANMSKYLDNALIGRQQSLQTIGAALIMDHYLENNESRRILNETVNGKPTAAMPSMDDLKTFLTELNKTNNMVGQHFTEKNISEFVKYVGENAEAIAKCKPQHYTRPLFQTRNEILLIIKNDFKNNFVPEMKVEVKPEATMSKPNIGSHRSSTSMIGNLLGRDVIDPQNKAKVVVEEKSEKTAAASVQSTNVSKEPAAKIEVEKDASNQGPRIGMHRK